MALDVWLDTDPAVGLPEADVDDGFALIQAFRSPELHVRGMSAVFGNAPLADTERIARELVAQAGPAGLEVHAGASGPDQLGVETAASAALAAALREAPLDVLALGPVTNVATVLQRHAELAPRLRRVVCVAGRRPGQEFRSSPGQPTPFPDLNFECDPAGMRVLLDSSVDLLLAGWEVASHVWITAADLDRLAAAGGTAAWLAERSRGWLAFWCDRLGATGFNPFDTLAVGAVAVPALVERMAVRVVIEDAGRVPHLVARAGASAGRHAEYCSRPAPGFKSELLGRLTSRP